jgi:hypothetical protein
MLEALERIYAECKRGTQVDPETARVTPRRNAGECLINVLDIAGEALRDAHGESADEGKEAQ